MKSPTVLGIAGAAVFAGLWLLGGLGLALLLTGLPLALGAFITWVAGDGGSDE